MPLSTLISPTIINGLLLLGLIVVLDRRNPNRHYLVTVLIAFILVIADELMHRFLIVPVGDFELLLAFALRVVLLWKVAQIQLRRAVVIAAVFEVLMDVVEPILILLALASAGPGH